MNDDHKTPELQPLWQRVLNLAAGTGLLVGLALLWAGPAHAAEVLRGVTAWLLA